MPVTCPNGHASEDPEYCDVCGAQLAPSSAHAPSGPPAPAGPSPGLPGPPPGHQGAAEASGAPGVTGSGAATGSPGSSGSSGSSGEVCPICQTPRSGRFCEVDGHDFESPLPDPVAPVLWEAVVGADRAYFDEVIALNGPDARAMVFPPYCPERAYPLIGKQVRIGRSSRTRGTFPEIDLGAPPADPGISHLHAVLMAGADGAWTLVDPGSANGTRVNGESLQVNVPVPVTQGDTIHLGAWTVITLRENAS
ncbi:FHA domain-containing protein [Nonomuraea sp. bgisy101]|uniref:FHA domain-containing protein n=1 Tax=Nonomuraea sp. bgisy101 TaxID=3413784 RepID=UPI003D73A057